MISADESGRRLNISTNNEGQTIDGDPAERQRRLEALDDQSLEDSRQNATIEMAKLAMEGRGGRGQAVRASTLPAREATNVTITPADRIIDRLVPLVDEALDILWERTTGAQQLQFPDDVDPDDLEDLLRVAGGWVNQIALGGNQDSSDLRDLFSSSTEVLLLCLTRARHEHRYEVIAAASKLALRAYEAYADQMVDAEEAAALKQIIPYWKMKRLATDYEAKRARRSRVQKQGVQASPSRRWGSSNIVVLFWAASPLQEERVFFEDERETLRKLPGVEIADRLAARPDELSQSIWEHKPDIVHFSGHGRDGWLVFRGDDETAILSADQIADLFRRAVGSHGGERLRCVVLNACYSAEIAEAIAEHVDCVIGTPTEIEDDDAVAFSKAFYQGISLAESVKVAFEEGRARIAHRAPELTDLPELKARDGVDPDGIWFRSRTAAAR